MSKRILFTFDERSRKQLEEIVSIGGFPSMADAVRCGLTILRSLQRHAQDGYRRVTVKYGSRSRDLVFPEIIGDSCHTTTTDAKTHGGRAGEG